MTNVNLYGRVVKVNNEVFIKVERSYKDQKGNFIEDLLPVLYWTKNKSNNFTSLNENTRVFVKGRLECISDKMFIIIEEYIVF